MKHSAKNLDDIAKVFIDLADKAKHNENRSKTKSFKLYYQGQWKAYADAASILTHTSLEP